jgi:peptidoglycan hydrolase-like protein with peptidoglycan-binding domain
MIPYNYMRQRFTHKVLIWLGVFLCVFLSVPNKSVAATIADFKVPEDFRFTRDISFGMTARPDVSYVQNILNMSTSTRVAISGAGSLKTPSNYYGVKTRDALARFQSIFAVDIEYEKSISTSTATSTTVVGSSTLDVFTRSVLNKLIIIYSGNRERYQEYVRTGTTTPGIYAPEGQLIKLESAVLLNKSLDIKNNTNNTNKASVGVAIAGVGSVPVPLNFGGVSTAMVTCTCSANLLIYVQDVRGPLLPLIYQPGVTLLYKWYQPRSGVNMLGNYVGGGACLIYAVTGCVPGGVPVGTMTQLGTSMTIAPGL